MTETRDTPAAIIYPPLDIKVIVDKTAGHVAKSGDAFQQLIREKYQSTAKFSFLYPNDPYYAYYSHMVEKYKSGDTTDAPADIPDSMDIDLPLVEAPERPDALQFAHAMPAISAQDLDVIKLTAQFVARNGRQFMTMLAQRESQNYQFDFMSPAHSLFPYFRKLVDQYTLVFFPTTELLDRVDRDRENKHQILDRVNRRMKWVAFEEEERQRKGREAEKEKEAFLSIDWHDFVVVGTVEFVEEDAFVDLPGPLRLQDLATMSLEDKHNSRRIDNGEAPKPASTVVKSTQPPAASSVKSDDEDEDDNDVEMEMDEDDENIDEEIEAERNPKAQLPVQTIGPMKIRKDYVPTLRRGPQIAKVTLQCQLCQLQIPASEFEEHIRVELIDPKWKEQKLIYEGKLRDSNLVQEGMDIARYLKQMASHRSDTLSKDTTTAAAQPVIWDGYSSTAGQATRRARENMSAEDQVAATHRKMGLRDPRDTTPQIGPQMGPPTTKRQKK
ncbi:SF3a splicing factor complex subunit [Coemansia sp. RSA 2337]|nr:SF3a splicing factor complex subunit [Coemansia sp. S2]KAJ2050893.1 SF3a splicing factor complex subunit [Coemansia sp. S16]KAJ2467143.1 SF3a splicing factor complex subunit [Coemansia sp. RSA 2337]